MAGAGPYSGTSTLALVARVTAVTLGVAYGSMKLAVLKVRFSSLITRIHDFPFSGESLRFSQQCAAGAVAVSL
ncbi:hypothetical protein R1flu_014015 [Riccia fluitans]|uniref:Uncharacterized protein n=1 Tax=Riccia fluitans TaxID=41844 RepID=A0ABD1YEW7_9MARC